MDALVQRATLYKDLGRMEDCFLDLRKAQKVAPEVRCLGWGQLGKEIGYPTRRATERVWWPRKRLSRSATRCLPEHFRACLLVLRGEGGGASEE